MFVDPEGKEVHGTDLSELMVISIQPQNLLASFAGSHILDRHCRGIVAAT